MKQVFIAIIVAIFILPSWSWAESEAMPRTIKSDPVTGEYQIEAVVTEINKSDRSMVVKGAQGRITTLYVDKSVQGFDKVKVNDKIVVHYKTAIAVALHKGGNGQRALVEAEASGPLQNYETGRVKTWRTTLVANVEAVDSANSIATLKGPKGNIVDVKVYNPEILKEIKKGDQVVAVIDESLAIALWPVEAQPKAK